MRAVQKTWFAKAAGRKMNPDNYAGYQCKDTADDYVQAIFPGKPWSETLRPGNGKDVVNNANPVYFTKIMNDWTKPDQLPEPGDIISWGWSPKVPEGHVAVVERVTRTGVHVLQQDGYAQVPAHRAYLPWTLGTGASVVGWLRPRPEKMPADKVTKVHVVRAGETLSGIAQLYRTTWKKLQNLNGIRNANSIFVGQKIKLP